MKKSHLLRAFVLFWLSCSSAFANVAYVTSGGSNPWGKSSGDSGSQENAMNTAFGTGGWDNLTFTSSDASVLFSSAYTFIYLEGGNHTANALEAYLTANNSLIESWVSNGGRLFINAAPNQGDGMDLGFGLNLIYNTNNDFVSDITVAVDSSHVIFNGAYGTTGDSFTGNDFSHATVAGNGLTALINGELNNGETGVVLGELEWGNGYVLVGGMTDPGYQSPQPEVEYLWANTLAYASTIPEPSTYAVWGSIGLLGLVAMRKRRK